MKKTTSLIAILPALLFLTSITKASTPMDKFYVKYGSTTAIKHCHAPQISNDREKYFTAGPREKHYTYAGQIKLMILPEICYLRVGIAYRRWDSRNIAPKSWDFHCPKKDASIYAIVHGRSIPNGYWDYKCTYGFNLYYTDKDGERIHRHVEISTTQMA